MNPFHRGLDRRAGAGSDVLGAALTRAVGAPDAENSGVRDRPRPGWYAYRATDAAELPWWATEVAVTIERPAAPATEDRASGPVTARHDPLEPQGRAPALVVLRAPGRARWLDPIAEALAEVESLAGLRSAPRGVGSVPGARGRRRLQLLEGPALPGLVPVAPAVAWAQLEAAGSRGLPAPLRRWRPAAGGAERSWRATAGSVLTCDGPDGTSAQAVVALRGVGDAAAILPPPGGALVLRAWKARRSWGVACGLVVAAATTLGLGREAGRVAARARAEGWGTSVLRGPIALRLARAGRPDLPAPEAAGQAATGAQVAAMFAACLAAAGLDREAMGSNGIRR